jgi:hypothetical protein
MVGRRILFVVHWNKNHIAPAFNSTAFVCPSCSVYSSQIWLEYTGLRVSSLNAPNKAVNFSPKFAYCSYCHQVSIWIEETLVYPSLLPVPNPNPDMPENIIADYEEARSIALLSPRGAAALLRLTIQKLCIYLGETGSINDAIGNLVRKGLPEKVKEALDIVRVVGNNAVHPGALDIKDDLTTVYALFDLVNYIASNTITRTRQIDELYKTLLTPNQRQGIVKRDQIG